jgi:zinc finger CCHC domain-containing protein 8
MGTGNDELLKSDLGLSDSHSQLGSNETKESKDDEESVELNEGAVGNDERMKNGESVELNEGAVGNDERMKNGESVELNEGAVGNNEGTKNGEGFELNVGVIGNDEVIVDPGYSALKVGNTGTEEAATDQSNLVLEERGIGSEEVHFAVETEVDMDLVDSPVRQVNIEVVDAVIVSKKPNISSITGNVEDCFLDTQNKSLIQQEKVDGSCILS